MAQKLYDDLDQCKTFPIMNSLLIEYSWFKKPFYVKDNVKYKDFSNLLNEISNLKWFSHDDASAIWDDLTTILNARNILAHWTRSFVSYWSILSMSDIERCYKSIDTLKLWFIHYLDIFIYKKLYLEINVNITE
jgi:hypothetical protein